MSALSELEAERDAAQKELSAFAQELRGLIEEHEHFSKENYEARKAVELKRSKVAGRVSKIAAIMSRIEGKVAPEIEHDIAKRGASVRKDEMQLREYQRDLHGLKFDRTSAMKKGARPDQLEEIGARITQLEGLVDGLEVDIEEQRKGLAAAETNRREALEALPEVAQELAALKGTLAPQA